MKLLERQHKALSLAGTVGLPAPFPAVGHIALMLDDQGRTSPSGRRRGSNGHAPEVSDEAMVKIVHTVSPKVTMIRFVRFRDISAVFVPDDPSKVNFDQGCWYMEKDLRGLAQSGLIEAGETPAEQEAPGE